MGDKNIRLKYFLMIVGGLVGLVLAMGLMSHSTYWGFVYPDKESFYSELSSRSPLYNRKSAIDIATFPLVMIVVAGVFVGWVIWKLMFGKNK